MSITCPECKKAFSQDEALDYSWVNAQRHFGCPHCKTFYKTNPFKA